MKLTRYFQSCLLVEEGSARILIDPSVHETENFDKFGKLDAVSVDWLVKGVIGSPKG